MNDKSKQFIKKYIPAPIKAMLQPYIKKHRLKKKVCINTPEDLDIRYEALKKSSEILNQFDIDWHVSGGTALGIARNGDFIPWDWDVGFGMKTEEVLPIIESIKKTFIENGFVLKRESYDQYKESVDFAYKNQTMELILWTLEGNQRRRINQTRPAKYFDKIEHRNLRDFPVPLPSPLEGYLEFLYGDWRTEKRTADKNVYRTKQTWI